MRDEILSFILHLLSILHPILHPSDAALSRLDTPGGHPYDFLRFSKENRRVRRRFRRVAFAGVRKFDGQVHRAFRNLKAVAEAAGGSLADCVKLTLFLTDLANFPRVNEIMQEYFAEPFPARSTVGVGSLPRNAAFEVEAVMVVG